MLDRTSSMTVKAVHKTLIYKSNSRKFIISTFQKPYVAELAHELKQTHTELVNNYHDRDHINTELRALGVENMRMKTRIILLRN